jgi:penicillin-binding protein 2
MSPEGEITQTNPITLTPIEAQKSAWNFVIQGMVNVIRGSQGTAAYKFGKPSYSAAAKTGTSQLFSLGQDEKYIVEKVPTNLRDNSMFIAFAPVDNPKIAVAIAVQNESTAASIARTVIDHYLLTEGYLYKNDAPDIQTTIQHHQKDNDSPNKPLANNLLQSLITKSPQPTR